MRTQADRDFDLQCGRDIERRDAKIDRLRKVLAEILDIIDHGDTGEAWQVALLAARAELATP